MKTITKYSTVLLLMIILATQSACVYYHETSQTPPPKDLVESGLSTKYVICHIVSEHDTTVWHLKPISLSPDKQTIVALPKFIDQHLVGLVINDPELKERHHAKRAAERDEIHLYIKDVMLIEDEIARIPVRSIFLSKEYAKDNATTFFAHLFPIALTAIIILGLSKIKIAMNFGNLSGI